jgi:hypothetical protein
MHPGPAHRIRHYGIASYALPFAPPSGELRTGVTDFTDSARSGMLLYVLLGLRTWPIPMGKISAQKATCRGEQRWK